MACNFPRAAWFSAEGGSPSFSERRGFDIRKDLSCGQCMGCRVQRKESWVTRCALELRMHEFSSFLTLTYDDDHCPADWSVSPHDRSVFLKRLRRRMAPTVLRYFGDDDYSPTKFRPHYHLIAFGYWPDDAVDWGDFWVSKELSALWGHGFCAVGVANVQSIGYIASHTVERVTGKAAKAAYERVDAETGEVWSVRPPRLFCSRRPGIGAAFVDRWRCDAANPSRDGVVVDGRVRPLGRYLDDKVAEIDSAVAIDREVSRFELSQSPAGLLRATPERRAMREACLRADDRRRRESKVFL